MIYYMDHVMYQIDIYEFIPFYVLWFIFMRLVTFSFQYVYMGNKYDE